MNLEEDFWPNFELNLFKLGKKFGSKSTQEGKNISKSFSEIGS